MFRHCRSVLRFMAVFLVLAQLVTVYPLSTQAAPPQPTGLVALPVYSNQVQLDWAQVAGAIQYVVYRSADGILYNPINTAPTINYTDTGLAPKTPYYYQVKAIGIDNSISVPATVSVTTYDADNTIPTVPANVTATSLNPGSIQLSWSPSSDIGGINYYEIYHSPDNVIFTLAGAVYNPATTYTHNGLMPGSTNYYNVLAVDKYNNHSPASATTGINLPVDTMKPTQPAIVSANVYKNIRIDLIWSGSTDNTGVSYYKLYRKTGAGVMTPIATIGATVYADNNVVPDTTYIYEVSAVDTAGNESDHSLQISRTTTLDTQPPSIPVNLSAVAQSASSIRLQWSPSTDNVGIGGYEVWRGTSYGNYPTRLTFTTATTYTDSSLSANTRYYYKIIAVDISGNISSQATADALTQAAQADTTKPEPPLLLTARASSAKTRVYLTWSGASDNVGVVNYEVYKSVGSGTAARLTNTSSTSYDDTDVSANNTYKYYIIAIDGAGNKSVPGITVSVTTNGDTEGPTPPADLKVTLTNDNETKLSWTASTDITGVNGYYVYRAVGSGSFYQLATTTGTSYTDKNLSSRETYRYYVVAFDTAGNTSTESTKESIYTSLKHQTMTGYIPADNDGVVELTDGFVRLEVPAKAIEQSTLFTLTVKTIGDYGAKGFYKAGRVVDITADKLIGSTGSTGAAAFKKNATLIFKYDTADLLGYSTNRLGIYKWDSTAKTWQRLKSSVNTSDRKVSAAIDTLGVYGLLIDTEAPRVPEFTGPDAAKELTSRVFLLKGKGEPFTKVEVSINWSVKYTFDIDSKGDFTGEILLTQGQNRLRVRGVDDAGNTGDWSEEVVFRANSPVKIVDTAGHWAEINIQKLVEAGVAGGYADNSFRPNKTITRAEFIRFVVAAAGLSGNSTGKIGGNTGKSGSNQELNFTDNYRIPDWAKESIAAAVKAGIISGYADGTFQPYKSITREEMAVILVRALNLQADATKKQSSQLSFDDDYAVSGWARGAVAVAVEKGVISGYADDSFKPIKNATRAEAATMVVRLMDLKKGKKD